MTARAALREATAAAHEEVDGIFSRFALGRGADYRRFLIAQASALLPIEAALDEAGAAALLPDWPERRRSEALLDDLEALGSDRPAPVPAPRFSTREAVLGGIYVLEGSRLGGAVLSRSVPADAPQAFLGERADSLRWRKLLEELEKLLYRHDQIAMAAEAAKAVFACFAAAGRLQLGTAHP